MSKPSHRIVLTKLVLYLNFLLWQLGSELKFQARADALLSDDEVSTLGTIRNKLGLKPAPYIYNTYCQDKVSSYGISIGCVCTYNDNTVCHITKISMNNIGLTTVIPEEVADLPYLLSIDLSANKLHGPIPAALGSLYNLQTLDLSKNQLTGSIPVTLGRLQKLRWLYLQFNLLDGTIPRSLGSLVNLEQLYLQFNRLSGSIPDELGNLVNLNTLELSENQLTGPLPKTLGNLSFLSSFLATANYLTDKFPESYGKLTSLKVFSISGNYISGPLPVDIVKRWTNIETLSLMGNYFKGNVTKEIFNLPKLQYLLISDLEDATFELPSETMNTKYVTLVLRNCSINGLIPKYIGDQMTSLKYLDLSFNSLTGGLPEYMKSDLLYMSFSTNMLNGRIPAWILHAVQTRIDLSFNNLSALDSGVPRNPDLNLFACCRNSATEPEMTDPLKMMNTYCQEKEQKYHSLFINCGGGETTVNGVTYEQDNDTARFFTSPNKNWAYSSSGDFAAEIAYSSDHTKNLTGGVSVAEAPLYDRARLSPVSLRYYAFCLREGSYTVTLKFAEIVYTEDIDYTSLRKRAFDISIQDDKIKVLQDFHISEQAGGPDKPITKNFTAVVNKNNSLLTIHMYWDGKGSITNEPDFNGPLISAISVTPEFKIHDEKLRPLHISLIGIGSTIISGLLLLAFAWMMGWMGNTDQLQEIDIGLRKPITLKQLEDGTRNFSKRNEIGRGFFGTVYKAELEGKIVAVKKLSSHLEENINQLKNEFYTLKSMSHENLVQLLDVYSGKGLHLLIYEYMQNTTLAHALFDSRCKLNLDWEARFNICLGIARGLAYLHEHPRLKMVHMNIKSSNILLDGNLKAKISDFGLATLSIDDRFNFIKVEVPQGYMAPEYVRGVVTYKADVYSFGVVVLETISGRKNIGLIKTDSQEIEFLLDKAYDLQRKGRLIDLVDKTLSNKYDVNQAIIILKLAVQCTSLSPTLRPTMSEVVSVLVREKTLEEIYHQTSRASTSSNFKGEDETE